MYVASPYQKVGGGIYPPISPLDLRPCLEVITLFCSWRFVAINRIHFKENLTICSSEIIILSHHYISVNCLSLVEKLYELYYTRIK